MNRADNEPVGIIGLGLLGGAIAERFTKAGFTVYSFDVRPECGGAAESAADVARRARRIVLSLPTSDICAAVIEEMEPHLAAGALIIDTTTGDPEQIAGFGAALTNRGVRYLDATVGGSSKLVREGAAIVMVGGDPGAFADSRDLLECFSRRAFHVGPCSSGARMKLVFNLVLGLNRAVLAEALSFAASYGIDPAAALEVLKAGAAYSKVMDIKGAKMLTGDFTPEARLSQHLKDVRLILAAAQRCGAMVPLSEIHRELLARAEAAGFGAMDNSAVIKAFEAE
jgi:3-hydroxyisobutyrate dehydrogenase-like beta-hydroxyacid dehydrogenase